MKKYPVLFLPLLFLLSCGGNNNEAAGTNADTTAAKENISFIPVTSILQNQFAALDTVQVTILQVKTENKKDDSAWLPAAKVKPLLTPFLSPVIDKQNMVPFFKETKFNDQSTAAVTFTYDPKAPLPDSFALRHWDIYFDPELNAIRRIYLVKTVMENNIPVTQQLTWQMNKWARIVTIINDKSKPAPAVTEIKWIWELDE
jgi:hypothetical protein